MQALLTKGTGLVIGRRFVFFCVTIIFLLVGFSNISYGGWQIVGTNSTVTAPVSDFDSSDYFQWGKSLSAGASASITGQTLNWQASIDCDTWIDTNFEWGLGPVNEGHQLWVNGSATSHANAVYVGDPEDLSHWILLSIDTDIYGYLETSAGFGYDTNVENNITWISGVADATVAWQQPDGTGGSGGISISSGSTNGISTNNPGNITLQNVTAHAEVGEFLGLRYGSWLLSLEFSISYEDSYELPAYGETYVELAPKLIAGSTAGASLVADSNVDWELVNVGARGKCGISGSFSYTVAEEY